MGRERCRNGRRSVLGGREAVRLELAVVNQQAGADCSSVNAFPLEKK